MTRHTIHRLGSGPGIRPRCGVPGAVRCSTSGVGVTCPRCLELERPQTREEALRALELAVAALHAPEVASRP